MLKSCEMCLTRAGPPSTQPADEEEAGVEQNPIPYPPGDTSQEYFLSPRSALRPNTLPCVLVFYTHHRPHLAGEDLKFFARARQRGWECQVIAHRNLPPMFPEDTGDEKMRGTVWGWRMVWKG